MTDVRIQRRFAAIAFADVIGYSRMFGRFPHRNIVLGRASTAEQVEFLQSRPGGF